MNRWTLLKHKISKSNIIDFHYDFLIEDIEDCLTWKIIVLPKIDGKPVHITQQPNHRLIWLSRNSYKLSRGRGYVSRVDYGTYDLIDQQFDLENFSLKLEGKIFRGILKKKNNLCYLASLN